jgi:anti-sigma28 factor (negative regulator of flagellin synthesis)
MMKIFGTTCVHGPQAIGSPHRGSATNTAQPASLSEVDRLDISPAGELVSQSLDGADRANRLAQIRAEIQAGTYETDDKLNAAVDRLLGEIG